MNSIIPLTPMLLMLKGFAPPHPPQSVRLKILEALALSQRLKDCLTLIKDPRVERIRLHQLCDILNHPNSSSDGRRKWLGRNGVKDRLSKQRWLSTFLLLPDGIPSTDTFRRVFELMNPKQFEQCFEQQLVNELGIQVIAIDGKNLRGSYDRDFVFKVLYFVSAWATEHWLVLGQSKVQDKSNGISAIPALLELLDIIGCIVTLDVMGIQKTIAAQIQHTQADYILGLKANHPTLWQQVNSWFQIAHADKTLPMPSEHKTEASHHHREIRFYWTFPLNSLPPLYKAGSCVGLRTIVIVERTRHFWNKTTHENQFYLSRLLADSPRITAAIRQRWDIEIPCIRRLMSPLVKTLVGCALSMPLTI